MHSQRTCSTFELLRFVQVNEKTRVELVGTTALRQPMLMDCTEQIHRDSSARGLWVDLVDGTEDCCCFLELEHQVGNSVGVVAAVDRKMDQEAEKEPAAAELDLRSIQSLRTVQVAHQ